MDFLTAYYPSNKTNVSDIKEVLKSNGIEDLTDLRYLVFAVEGKGKIKLFATKTEYNFEEDGITNIKSYSNEQFKIKLKRK